MQQRKLIKKYMKEIDRPQSIQNQMIWLYINDKITRRGIAKGLVNIQEDFNKSILEVEKQTIKDI